jgi:DNA excision repair protein ERCC-2
LQSAVSEAKSRDADALRREYEELLQGLKRYPSFSSSLALPARTNPQNNVQDDPVPSPVLPEDLVKEAIPEEIRKADKFLAQSRKFLDFVRGRMSIQQVRNRSEGGRT